MLYIFMLWVYFYDLFVLISYALIGGLQSRTAKSSQVLLRRNNGLLSRVLYYLSRFNPLQQVLTYIGHCLNLGKYYISTRPYRFDISISSFCGSKLS